MTKKQTTSPYAPLEKVLTITGLIVVVIGCIANVYGAYINRRFMYDPIDLIYYFRYLLLLGGGFIVGYLMTKKSTDHSRYPKLFRGVSYAGLTMMTYALLDFARVGLQGIVGNLSYPWGKLVFEGAPLLAVIIALLVAYYSQYKPNRVELSNFTKGFLVFSFIGSQVYILANNAYYSATSTASYDPSSMPPLWLIICSYLLMPLAIAIVSYLLLTNIKQRFARLFYTALIGTLYSTLMTVLWEFRTDATSDATNIFSSVVTICTLVFVSVLLWRAYKATKAI